MFEGQPPFQEALEQQVLRWIIAEQFDLSPELEQQVGSAIVTGRDFTSKGFFADLKVCDGTSVLRRAPRVIESHVLAEFAGDELAGFLLYTDEGLIDCLEGHAYGNTPWTELSGPFRIFLSDHKKVSRTTGQIAWSLRH